MCALDIGASHICIGGVRRRRQRRDVSMSTGVVTALVGVGGVLVGALVSSRTQIRMDKRKAKREERRDAGRREGQLRLAVRLVVEELSEAEQMIREAAAAAFYWKADRQLPNAAWVKYRAILATHVPGPADWLGITPAFTELDRLNRLVGERRGAMADGDRVPVEPEDDTYVAWYTAQRAIWGSRPRSTWRKIWPCGS